MIPTSISDFRGPVIIVPQMKDPSTHYLSYRMDVDFRRIYEQLEYWSYPIKWTDRLFQNCMEQNYSQPWMVKIWLL